MRCSQSFTNFKSECADVAYECEDVAQECAGVGVKSGHPNTDRHSFSRRTRQIIIGHNF